MVPSKSAGTVSISVCVRSQSQLEAVKAREGQTLARFLTQALQGAVGASASGSTENKGLLTSQALSRASLGRQQAFVVSCASAAVTRLCFAAKLGYYN